MSFEVEHDWQASLSTPKPSIGERAKTRLLLLLCFLWLTLGLVGHHPWKPEEAQSVSAVKHLLDGGHWHLPSVAGMPTLENLPLYYLSAAASAKMLSPWLPMHDGARLATGVWMALTLLLVGMTGREMWGIGAGRQTTFIFLSSIGLFFSAHLLNPEVAALTGNAMAFYGLALARRRPWRAAPLIGCGIGIAFLSSGLLAAGILLLTGSLMPLLFVNWRIKSYLTSMALGFIIAFFLALMWLIPIWLHSPDVLLTWLNSGKHLLNNNSLLYFANLLTWFAWPALPLAAWSLWHFRKHLLQRPQFQLALLFLVTSLLLLGLGAEKRDILALPLLLPLAVMGGAAIEELRRGAASAINWFGIMLFGTFGFLIWLGWFAMMTGIPVRLANRMHVLSEAYVPHFKWLPFLVAVAMSAIWLLVVYGSKRSNRAAVTDWAIGITMVWGLLMMLWLPWLDATKSYQGMFASMKTSLPISHGCITSHDVGEFQRSLLHYYADIRTRRIEKAQKPECDLYLVQDERKPRIENPGQEWRVIWEGHRPSDRRERFRLYQRFSE